MKVSLSPQFLSYACIIFLMFVATWDVASIIFTAPFSHSSTFTLSLSSLNSVSPSLRWTNGIDGFHSRRLANDDDTFYNNPNDTYSPNQFVQYGHQLTGEKFSTKTSYLERVLYSPIVIFGLGVLALAFFNLGLLCRCCVDSCKCIPQQDNEQKYKQNELILNICFYVFLLLVLIIDQLVFLGNQQVDSGVKNIDNNIQSLQQILNDITDNSKLLQAYGYDLSTEYTAACSSCASSYINGYSDEISTYQSSMDDLVDALSPVNKALKNVHDYLNVYGIYYRNIGLYVVWGLAILCAFCILFCKLMKTVMGMKCMLFFTMCVYVLYLILGVPWVLITSVGGDLCMSPTKNMLDSLPKGSDLQSIATYYATCQGNNTLQSDIDDGVSSLVSLNSSLTLLLTPPSVPGYNCPGDHNVQALQSTINDISDTVDVIEGDLSCSPIQKIWLSGVNTGFCEDLYTGIFYIWGSQLVTSFFLFLLMVTMSIVYQYFELVKIAPSGGGDDAGTPADKLGDDVELEEHHHAEPAEMVKYELIFDDSSQQKI